MMKNHLSKGQVTLVIAILGGLGTLLASGISAWAVSSNRVSELQTQISVVETTEELHYKELKEDTEEIKSLIQGLYD